MACNRHDDNAIDLSAVEIVYPSPATTAGASAAEDTGLQLPIEKDGFCTVHPAFGAALERRITPLLNVEAIDHHIRHWQRKADSAPDDVTRAVAEGHVSGLQLARVIHHLPLLEEGE